MLLAILMVDNKSNHSLLGIASINELLPPVQHKDSLEESVGCLGQSRNIASKKSTEADIDKNRQFTTHQNDSGIIEEETFIHPYEILKEVAKSAKIVDFGHMGVRYIVELGV